MVAAIVLAALGGLIIGSFLNVVAYRLPRGESLAHPPSRCPSCEAPVKPYDNIPVLSWLLLRADQLALPRGGGDHSAALRAGDGRALGRRLGHRARDRARHGPDPDRADR